MQRPSACNGIYINKIDNYGNITNTVNLAMAAAAEGGHESIVRLCHDAWGAAEVNKAMASAALYLWPRGHRAVVPRRVGRSRRK